jgi:hypothetical protein
MNHTYLYILLRKLNILIPMVDFDQTFPVLLAKLTSMTAVSRIYRDRPTRGALCNGNVCLYAQNV